jgi:hypothetical protein
MNQKRAVNRNRRRRNNKHEGENDRNLYEKQPKIEETSYRERKQGLYPHLCIERENRVYRTRMRHGGENKKKKRLRLHKGRRPLRTIEQFYFISIEELLVFIEMMNEEDQQ